MERDDNYFIAIIIVLIMTVVFYIIEIIELKNENDRLQTEVKLLRARDDINIKHIERLHLLGGEELTRKFYAVDVKED